VRPRRFARAGQGLCSISHHANAPSWAVPSATGMGPRCGAQERYCDRPAARNLAL